jgi:hypothetical protein
VRPPSKTRKNDFAPTRNECFSTPLEACLPWVCEWVGKVGGFGVGNMEDEGMGVMGMVYFVWGAECVVEGKDSGGCEGKEPKERYCGGKVN